MFGRPYRDVWSVDTGTGDRRQLLTRVRHAWPSDGGDWMLWWDGTNYHTLDIGTGEEHDVTSGLAENFANTEYDTPTDLMPAARLRLPAPGWKTTKRSCCTASTTSGVWRPTDPGARGSRAVSRPASPTAWPASPRTTTTPGIDPDSRPYLTLYNEKHGTARLCAA